MFLILSIKFHFFKHMRNTCQQKVHENFRKIFKKQTLYLAPINKYSNQSLGNSKSMDIKPIKLVAKAMKKHTGTKKANY